MKNFAKNFKLLALALAALLCATLSAQDQRFVAVPAPIGKTSGVTQFNKDIVRAKLQEFIVNLSEYKVVDRTSTDQIMEEHVIQRSGVVDTLKVAELGKLVGAHLVCVTYLTREEGYFHAEASIIDVTTGEIFNSAGELIENDSVRAINTAIKELVVRLLKLEAQAVREAKDMAEKELDKELREEESRDIIELMALQLAEMQQAEKDRKSREETAEREKNEQLKKSRSEFPKFGPARYGKLENATSPVPGKVIVFIFMRNKNVKGVVHKKNSYLLINKSDPMPIGYSRPWRFELDEGTYEFKFILNRKSQEDSVILEGKAGSVYFLELVGELTNKAVTYLISGLLAKYKVGLNMMPELSGKRETWMERYFTGPLFQFYQY